MDTLRISAIVTMESCLLKVHLKTPYTYPKYMEKKLDFIKKK